MHALTNCAYIKLGSGVASYTQFYYRTISKLQLGLMGLSPMPCVILGQLKAIARYFSRCSAASHLEMTIKSHLERF